MTGIINFRLFTIVNSDICSKTLSPGQQPRGGTDPLIGLGHDTYRKPITPGIRAGDRAAIVVAPLALVNGQGHPLGQALFYFSQTQHAPVVQFHIDFLGPQGAEIDMVLTLKVSST